MVKVTEATPQQINASLVDVQNQLNYLMNLLSQLNDKIEKVEKALNNN